MVNSGKGGGSGQSDSRFLIQLVGEMQPRCSRDTHEAAERQPRSVGLVTAGSQAPS